MNKRNAFTLMEMIIVCCIMGIILCCIPLQNTSNTIHTIQRQQFSQQLSEFLLTAQTTAIAYQQTVNVKFDSNNQYIHYITTDHTISDSLLLPEHWSLPHHDSFYYFSDGRVNRYHTIYIWYEPEHVRYAITFQLGSGRFEIIPR